jgi:hypothetical protein
MVYLQSVGHDNDRHNGLDATSTGWMSQKTQVNAAIAHQRWTSNFFNLLALHIADSSFTYNAHIPGNDFDKFP